MATLTHAQVRQRLAEALEGHAIDAGTLREAPVVYDRVGQVDGVPDGRVHLAFAVALLDSIPSVEQRQGSGRPLLTTSRVGVRLLHRLRRSDEVSDLDSSLVAEEDVVARLLARSRPVGIVLAYTGTTRRVRISDPESQLSEITFRAHYYVSTT